MAAKQKKRTAQKQSRVKHVAPPTQKKAQKAKVGVKQEVYDDFADMR